MAGTSPAMRGGRRKFSIVVAGLDPAIQAQKQRSILQHVEIQ
jgi:hypothetical protein